MDLHESLEKKTTDLRFLENRTRWDGILSADQVSACRSNGIALGYDCSQQGWVIYDEQEEFGDDLYATTSQETAQPREIKKIADHLSEELATELVHLNASLGQLDVCFQAIDNVMNKAGDIVGTLNSREELHCLLSCKMAELLKFQLPEKADMTVDYRPWETTDVDIFMRIMANENVWQHLPEDYPEPFTRELASSLIEIANVGDSGATQAIIVGGEIVGQIRLLTSDSYSSLKAAEVVYMLDECHWGRGLMSKILSDFVSKAFAKGHLDIIYAWIKQENPASVKCAENAGFIRDKFSHEQEWAIASQRPGFSRYVCFRS